MTIKAEIISVGTEILLGEILNSDAQIISSALSELGINLYYQTVVGDNYERLSEVFKTALSRSDIIILTGGLGPTYDDITKKTAADALNLRLIEDNDVLKRIQAYFDKKNVEMTPNNKLQALIPQGAKVLQNDWGTAPGIMIEYNKQKIFMLPGPPYECENMLKNRLIPILKEQSDGIIKSKFIRVFGIGESAVEYLLRDIMANAQNPTAAPYAKDGEALVRITAKAADEKEADKLLEPLETEIIKRLGTNVYGINCASLEDQAAELLKKSRLTVSCAESCTGGLLAERLTSISGASNFFPGSIVSYTEEIKNNILKVKKETIEHFGVVSLQTAQEMALQASITFKTDIGIGITGYAGPSAPSENDLGHIFVCVYFKKRYLAKELRLTGNRNKVRRLASSWALKLLIDVLKENNLPKKLP